MFNKMLSCSLQRIAIFGEGGLRKQLHYNIAITIFDTFIMKINSNPVFSIRLLDGVGGIIEAERFSVMDGRSELVKGIAVFFCCIAHVFIPTILWKFMMKIDHQLVSIIFC